MKLNEYSKILAAFFIAPPEKCDPAFRRAFWGGFLLWLLLALAFVVLRGVRWDESYEHAQVLAGLIHYPEGHPLPEYLHSAFSLQTWISTLLLQWGFGPAVVCGFRNLLFLWASILPVYCLTALLGRRPLWAHLAVLFLLHGILLEFDGSYPTFVWPELYSNGHIGGGLSVLTLVLFAAGRFRSAFLCSALMAAVHLGQFPMALGLCLCAALFFFLAHRQRELLLPGILLLAGVLLTVALSQLSSAAPGAAPPLPGYQVEGNAELLWRSWTAFFDPHRRFPPGNGHLLLAGCTLLSLLAAWQNRGARQGRALAWICLYCVGVGTAVWGIMAVHYLLGKDIPFLLIFWMPYRLINHLPPILLALMIALLSDDAEKQAPPGITLIPLAALAWLTLHPWLAGLFPEAIYQRYLAQGDGVAFALFGAVCWRLGVQADTKKNRSLIYLLFGLTLIATLPYHRFGAAALAGGALSAALLARRPMRFPKADHLLTAFGYAVGLLALGLLMRHQAACRQWLPQSAGESALASFFEKAEEPDTLILAEPYSYMLQARLNCPVLVEAATPSLISYAPQLAPLINQIYDDLYNIRFLPACASCDHPAHQWPARWESRSEEEWRQLAIRYGFTHILTPPNLHLNLPLALELEDARLYRLRQ